MKKAQQKTYIFSAVIVLVLVIGGILAWSWSDFLTTQVFYRFSSQGQQGQLLKTCTDTGVSGIGVKGTYTHRDAQGNVMSKNEDYCISPNEKFPGSCFRPTRGDDGFACTCRDGRCTGTVDLANRHTYCTDHDPTNDLTHRGFIQLSIAGARDWTVNSVQGDKCEETAQGSAVVEAVCTGDPLEAVRWEWRLCPNGLTCHEGACRRSGSIPADDASCARLSLPPFPVPAGTTFAITAAFSNQGNNYWQWRNDWNEPAPNNYYVTATGGKQNRTLWGVLHATQDINRWDPAYAGEPRIYFNENDADVPLEFKENGIPFGQNYNWRAIAVQAPAEPGTYPIEVQMGTDQGGLFGQACTGEITVVPADSRVPRPFPAQRGDQYGARDIACELAQEKCEETNHTQLCRGVQEWCGS